MADIKVYNTSFLSATPKICTTAGAWANPVSLQIYNGTAWVTVWPTLAASIDDRTVEVIELEPDTATAIYRLSSDGSAYSSSSGTLDLLEIWLDSGTASGFEVRATVTSGTLSSGTTGSWQVLSTDRSWTVTRSAVGVKSATMTVEIRNATTLAVLDSASITLQATVQDALIA